MKNIINLSILSGLFFVCYEANAKELDWTPKHEKELIKEHEVDQNGTKFAPGKGLKITSKNEKFSLTMRLRAQFLYSFEHEDKNLEHGFQIRRARLAFGGHFWDKNIKYKTEFAVSPRDMGMQDTGPKNTPILDWYVSFTHLTNLSARIGQFKVPFSRQRVISSGDLQLVDRSIANSEFNLDRDIGIDLYSENFLKLDRIRYNAGVYFGEGRDQFKPSNFDLFYLGRIEFMPLGKFEDYSEVDFERSNKPRLTFGTAYAFIDGAQKNRGILGDKWSDEGTTDYHNVVADTIFKIAGLSLQGEFFYRQGKRTYGDATVTNEETGQEEPAEQELSRNGFGWMTQAGFLIPKTAFEIAGRYSNVSKTKETSLENENEVVGGLNYYFARHPLKLQLDYSRLYQKEIKAGNDLVRLQLQAGF